MRGSYPLFRGKRWGPGLAGERENMAPYLIPQKAPPAETMGTCPRRGRVLGSRSGLLSLHRTHI